MIKLILAIAVFAALLLVPDVSQQAIADHTCGFGDAGNICSDHGGGQCFFGVCALGSCVATPNLGAPCDDGNVCTAGGICIVGGLCVGTDLDGDFNGNACGNQNPTGACDGPNECLFGVCSPNPANNGDSCGDGETECSNQDTCFSGICLPNHKIDAECESVGLTECTSGPSHCATFTEPATSNEVGLGFCALIAPDENEGNNCGDGPIECSNQDTCTNIGTCESNHKEFGTLCEDGLECTTESKCALGLCAPTEFKPVDTACGDPSDTECTDPDTCNAVGLCLPRHELPTVSCEDGLECTTESKCALGLCAPTEFKPVDTACGDPSDTECSDPNTCGLLGLCRPNNTPGELCDDGNECTTIGVCGLLGNCNDGLPKFKDVACGDGGTECTNQDTCDGSGTCDDNGFKPAATACGDGSDTECTSPDACDGSGTCESNDAPAATACGDGGTECTNQDTCDGLGTCDDNGFKAIATVCGDGTDTECTAPDTCDGLGACEVNHEPDGSTCGDQGVECNVDDECSSGECQDNGFLPEETDCSIGMCDPTGECEFTIDKFYTHTNNDWSMRCDGVLSNEICYTDDTLLVESAFRPANINQDNNIFAAELPPLPDDGQSPFYLEGDQKGKRTVITPGQYIAVSMVDILVKEKVTVIEDFGDCSDHGVNIGNINPDKAPGGVLVVVILENGDVIDIDDLLAEGTGGSITLTNLDPQPSRSDQATVVVSDWDELGIDPVGGQLRVMIKFQPDDSLGMVGLSCVNVESVINENGNMGQDTAELVVIQKVK